MHVPACTVVNTHLHLLLLLLLMLPLLSCMCRLGTSIVMLPLLSCMCRLGTSTVMLPLLSCMCRLGTSIVLSNVTSVVGEEELYNFQTAFVLLFLLSDAADYPRYANGRVRLQQLGSGIQVIRFRQYSCIYVI